MSRLISKSRILIWLVVMGVTFVLLFILGVMPLDNLFVNGVFTLIIGIIVFLSISIFMKIINVLKNRGMQRN